MRDEGLPLLYVKYSDHYVSGQKMTGTTIEYLYCREVMEITKVNTYMGLWQLAQASSALNVPIQSVYPTGGDPIMRLDFNRIFFPIEYDSKTGDDPLVIRWTSAAKGSVPAHFVPLLKKRQKYENVCC